MADGDDFLFDEETIDLFKEPENYYPPEPEPVFETFERYDENIESGDTVKTLTVRLLGHHPLWGHLLWNAAKEFSHFIDRHPSLVRNKTVLELGAGAALPSLLAGLNGARRVVVTDYPEEGLLDNIRGNIERILPEAYANNRIQAQGFLWGADPTPLLAAIQPPRHSVAAASDGGSIGGVPVKFDTLILCDLIFNHSQHRPMLQTCRACLSDDPAHPGEAYVFFTHHRPHYMQQDLAFFTLAASPEFGFKVDNFQNISTVPMFEKDPGSPTVRGTVHCYRLTWA
ncbi:Protein N-terminal and lysine N-methyltransferase efm7 [Tieghemiomyces parasiticus]|uniref:Protein N-terminal and lysine N-methyltransferase EFM7 n=1 Tax=Tieghemiomyces parasiticus TaxID=78921 RepID=A0A9W8ADW0_9FUNG|nr:Protein N-terminal and lysine N-methyltransferase efm7 [Tieghemiomyces parasiticus]